MTVKSNHSAINSNGCAAAAEPDVIDDFQDESRVVTDESEDEGNSGNDERSLRTSGRTRRARRGSRRRNVSGGGLVGV